MKLKQLFEYDDSINVEVDYFVEPEDVEPDEGGLVTFSAKVVPAELQRRGDNWFEDYKVSIVSAVYTKTGQPFKWNEFLKKYPYADDDIKQRATEYAREQIAAPHKSR